MNWFKEGRTGNGLTPSAHYTRGLDTRRWLSISQQKALTSEKTQKHLWGRCRFQTPELILTCDLPTTTYPNNRAVCGNLCNSRWNQRRSSTQHAARSTPLRMTSTEPRPLHPTLMQCSVTAVENCIMMCNRAVCFHPGWKRNDVWSVLTGGDDGAVLFKVLSC